MPPKESKGAIFRNDPRPKALTRAVQSTVKNRTDASKGAGRSWVQRLAFGLKPPAGGRMHARLHSLQRYSWLLANLVLIELVYVLLVSAGRPGKWPV